MNTPVQFLTKDAASDPLKDKKAIPKTPGIALAINAIKMFFEARRGSYLQQGLIGSSCSMYIYDFFNRTKNTWYPYSAEPRIVIVYLLNATVSGNLSGFGPVTLKEGFCYLFYLPPGLRHEAFFPKGHSRLVHLNLSHDYLVELGLSHEWIARILQLVEISSPAGIYKTKAPIIAEMIRQMNLLWQYDGDPRNFRTYMRARVIDLLLAYVNEIEKKDPDPSKEPLQNLSENERMLMVQAMIDTNVGRKLSVAELCRRTGLNKFTLQKKMKKMVGLTIDQYQKMKRLEKCARMLIDYPDRSVFEIGYRAGYKEESHFISEFKKVHNLTPLRYRKKFME